MTDPVTRVEPAVIPSLLKEAVADALLGQTFARISGEGENGRAIYGLKPRQALSSGFLLPRRRPEGDDEVTSPIWISSLGTQFEVNAHTTGIVRLTPRASVYLRVLPTLEEFEQTPLGNHLSIRQEIVQRYRSRRAELIKALRGELGDKNHPDWSARREEIEAQAWTHAGVPESLRKVLVKTEGTQDALDDEEPDDDGASIPLPEQNQEELHREVLAHQALLEPLTIPDKWQRLDFDLPDFEVDLNQVDEDLEASIALATGAMQTAIEQQLADWAASDEGKNWGYRTRPGLPVSAALDWAQTLESLRARKEPDALPVIHLRWEVERTRNFLDPSRNSIKITLENVSEPQNYVTDTEHSLFLAGFQMQLPFTLHAPLKLARVKPSYRYNAYLNYPAMGVNNGMELIHRDDKQVTLRTTWRPRYDQPRIVPTSPDGVSRKIRALTKPEGIDGLMPLVPAYTRWIEQTRADTDYTQGLLPTETEAREKEYAAFSKDLENWERERDAIDAGLRLLQESRKAWSARGPQTDPKAYVFEAWLAMNEAMANFMENKLKTDKAEWRLFQIAFVLASLPALASRMDVWRDEYYDPKRDDAVTLLYFATGGGKSEAFFGLLVFALLFDRLRGKRLGVTALVRYPLRLLTIQQAQRCARVLAYAEEVRRKHAYGGHPLSIGFWVGSSGSPNSMKAEGMRDVPKISDKPADEATEECLLETDYRAARTAWRKLPTCPKCHTETALRQYVAHGDTMLGHFCMNTTCMFNEGGMTPLPFYIVDENIYARAPSVLLGTVDKLALIGHSGNTIRRILGMFGAAPWIDPKDERLVTPRDAQDYRRQPSEKNLEGIAPAYPDGVEVFHDPFPALIVQDEAHLLDESLGSFSGLFESTLESVLRELAKPLGQRVARAPDGTFRRAKVIAASATVSEPDRQLEHLYQRSIPAMQFPAPGPSLYESFYYSPRPGQGAGRNVHANPEVSSEWARVYMAFMTNGRPHTSVTTAILANFNLVITENFRALCSADDDQIDAVRTQLASHVSDGPLAQMHREVIVNADEKHLATLIDLHRVNLTYVTNKKGGDQLLAAQAEETRKLHDREGQPILDLETRLISGAVDQGEIQKVIEDAQDRVPTGAAFKEIDEELRSVIATSAISHGVDVDEFNSMVFAGMPSGIDEYIQASSRVGRTHIGFVLLVPTPQQRRDRHIVHIFDSYHRFLERMVQPAAIDRYAEKAVMRVLPSVMQTYLLGVVPCVSMLSTPDKNQLEMPFQLGQINQAYRSGGKPYMDRIVGFIQQAIGLVEPYTPNDPDYYRNMIESWARERVNDDWSNQTTLTESVESYFRSQTRTILKPMMSLRDVDEMGTIFGGLKHSQPAEHLLNAMDVIRGGTANIEESENS
ncbi:helicase-related protein [Chromohalobacter sp.]|uniref:helicase-related protein n=1 Tax=Chromohalobacter sp. TaxID=50740 RepID=UPI003242BC75